MLGPHGAPYWTFFIKEYSSIELFVKEYLNYKPFVKEYGTDNLILLTILSLLFTLFTLQILKPYLKDLNDSILILANLLFSLADFIDNFFVAVFNHLNIKSIIKDPNIAIMLDIPAIEYAKRRYIMQFIVLNPTM